VRYQYISPGAASVSILQQHSPSSSEMSTPASRRLIEYEAGLRRFGPNHRPQHSWTGGHDDDDDDDGQLYPAHRLALANGIYRLVPVQSKVK